MAAGNCLDVVLAKVKRLEAYANQPTKEQRKVAHALTNRKPLFNRFEHLLQAVEEEVHMAITDYEANFTHSIEFQSAHQRAKHGMARVCHLPVKLFLSRLQRYPSLLATSITGRLSEVMLEFGALHAGLMVGDIRVEWGAEGLIDPQWEDPQFVEEDFIAHVHPGGEWALAAASYDKKFSLADRERRIEDKIELIMDTAEEKRQLIMNLVDVIVSYNCTKQYSVMKCNCQHFVSEAMHALGIKSTPKFSGPLNDYLQQLKSYRLDIPEEFIDHASLDAYVKPKLQADTLSQHDMEYLLLHYYRLHLDSLPEDGDIDNWRCEVRSCQYEFLAEKVNRQAMVCHQFLRQRTRSSVSSRVQRPTTLRTIPEAGESANHPQTGIIVENTTAQPTVTVSTNGQRNGVASVQPSAAPQPPKDDHLQRDLEVAQAIAKQNPLDNQEVAIQGHALKGYYSRVMTKLRELPKYAEKSDDELHDLVEALTGVESFRANCECFRAIVEIPMETLAINSSKDKDLIDQTQLHHSVATNKVAERYEKVCKFPVKLVLRVKPTRSGTPSGGVTDASLHAALLISDHLFEWDERSLVIPNKVDFTKQPALTTGILYGSEWFTYINHQRQRSRLEDALTSPPGSLHKQEIDLMFDLTTKKDDLIKSVIETIIDYNRNKKYHHQSCNNRHFIQDVTRALGVKKLPAFGASLKQQLDKSKRQCSRRLSRTELSTHTDLDTYVCDLGEEKLQELTVVDLEYLVGKYFHFHIESWELSPVPDQWSCQQRNCQLTNIEEQLERTALSGQSNCVLL